MRTRSSLAAVLLLMLGVVALVGAAELFAGDDCCSELGSAPVCAPCLCCPCPAMVAVQPAVAPAAGLVSSFVAVKRSLRSFPPRGVLHVPKAA